MDQDQDKTEQPAPPDFRALAAEHAAKAATWVTDWKVSAHTVERARVLALVAEVYALLAAQQQ